MYLTQISLHIEIDFQVVMSRYSNIIIISRLIFNVTYVSIEVYNDNFANYRFMIDTLAIPVYILYAQIESVNIFDAI